MTSSSGLPRYLSSLQNRTSSTMDEVKTLSKLIKDCTNTDHIVLEYTEELNDNQQAIEDTIFDTLLDTLTNVSKYRMRVPLRNNTDKLALLTFIRSSEVYTEKDLSSISSYLGVLQLHCEINKLNCSSASNNQDLLAASVSHEIRTPLNGVIGYAQLLLQTDLDQKQHEFVNSLNQCSIQLMQIINDILDFSKLLRGRMDVNKDCFPIRELSANISRTLESKLNEKRQTLEFKYAEDLPSFIIVDRCKVTQILMNLVSNSIKYSGIGNKIIVDISKDKSLETLLINVIDSGHGIEPSDLDRIFDPFVRVDNTGATGTGLGLVIAKKLVELMNGQIGVKSIPGIKTVFSFTLDYIRYDHYKQEILQDVTFLTGKDILVVDDNTDNRVLLTEWLLAWNAKPVVCASALEALRYGLSPNYDFVIGLIDICMPGISGIELAEQLNEARPNIPLIGLSSIDSRIDRSRFVAVLEKPINRIQLGSVISTAINTFSGQDIINEPGRKKQIKILICEDMDYNRNLLVSMLDTLGYHTVLEAIDGKIAIDQLDACRSVDDPIQVVLLDLRMPKIDGFGVLEHIENYDHDTRPKVIITSASVLEIDKKRATQYGVEHFLIKPLQLSQLSRILATISEAILDLNVVL